MKLLIVEDEVALANGLKFNFEQEGYEVTLASDGPAAMEAFQAAQPSYDLVILDLMLPSMSGYEICRRIRELDPFVPVLVLSARTLSEDRTMAFDCGSDQYMTKPFALPELLSRVRNLTERHATRVKQVAANPAVPDAVRADVVRFGNVTVDFRKFEISGNGPPVTMTTKENQLLRYLVEHDGQVISRAEILEEVWEESADITTRSIDNFILRLRRYIEANPAEPRHILSVRGTGYRFVTTPDS